MPNRIAYKFRSATVSIGSSPLLAAISLAIIAWTSPAPAFAQETNIVLVHGMNADGSTWRPVYDELREDGGEVSVVQLPLTGFEDDLSATRRAIDAAGGDVLLVGHSYGGIVITTAGNHPDVKGLVYVAALQPDAGETMASLNERMPSVFEHSGSVVEDGYATVTREAFLRDVGPDIPTADAEFIVASQTPTSVDVFQAPTSDPAWRQKPSFGIVASEDRVVSPDLQRWMYERAGGPVTEIESGHMLILSRPAKVAAAIIDAANAIGSQ